MARRSGAESGFTVATWSTKARYPLSVGTRPAEVWGWVISPSSSSTDMSLRTVAAETPSSWRSSSDFEPTGSRVET